MKVLVKQDSATTTPVDCGEGEAGKEKLRRLVQQYGADVTMEDGSPVPAEVEPKKEKEKAKAKAKSKSKRGR